MTVSRLMAIGTLTVCLASRAMAGSVLPPSTLALPVPSGEELAARAAADPQTPRLNPFAGHGAGMGLSLLLPGLGQMHEGHRTRGWVFLGIDGALWTTLAVSEVQSHLRGQTYREVARAYALVSDGTHSATFYRDVGSYSSSDIYNIYLRREARAVFESQSAQPDSAREAFIDDYVQQHGYFGNETWEWDTYEHYLRYTNARRGQHDAARRASLAIGGLVVNRLFAVLDLTRTRRAPGAASRRADERVTDFAFSATPDGRMTCGVQTRF